MKKSLLILSMMAIAATAVAYDAPVAGTTDAPNYYVIKANRGDYRYMAYSDNSLTRTSDLSEANIWAITPGTVDGAVTIKSYTADAYLVDFKIDGVSTTEMGATAYPTSEPTNIFPVSLDGAFALNINSPETVYCTSIDAPGGASTSFGNWVPTKPSSGEGGCFWFYKVDLTNGVEAGIAAVNKTIEDEAAAAALEAAKQAFAAQVELYLNSLKTYAENVPQVAEYINAGIAQLEALEFSEDYAEKISQIWSNTFNQANTVIKTVLNGNTYAIKNLRRVTEASEGAYLTVGDAKYVGATTYTSANSIFTFTSTSDGGYTIYNEATKTWIGANAAPVSTEAEAQAFYPVINSFKAYAGFMLRNGADSDQGLNWQSWNNGSVTIWNTADEGSIWSLIDFDTEKAVSDAIIAVSSQFNSYAENLPIIEEIFSGAISKMKELTYSDDLNEKLNEIKDNALSDANDLIATGLNGKTFALKYIRGGEYLNVTDNEFTHAADDSAASSAFTFTSTADGGYTIFNKETKQYISTGLTLTANVDEAVAVYPALQSAEAFYGIALWFSADHTGNGINMNSGKGLHDWSGTDPGSIWGLKEVANTDALTEVRSAISGQETIYDLQGRRLAAPIKGINIINGKKVLVK